MKASTAVFGKKVFALKLADMLVTFGTLFVFYHFSRRRHAASFYAAYPLF
ncbi:hypothetical protein [Chitinophaga alhagiae]|nr:hypothetical protein [Chitinophaga alhagiae]